MINGILGYILYVDQYIGPLIQNYGLFIYPLFFLIIFMETGFVITPFLPGDSLLFVAGTFAATGALNLSFLLIIFTLAAILGDSVNYWLGSYFGTRFFSKYINKKYLDKTRDFYDRHGPKTIIIARFIPIIRSFAPFVAGIGKMRYSRFFIYNVIGGIAWVLVFVFAGYFFGSIPLIKDNLTIAIIAVIILSFVPAIIEYIKYRRASPPL